MATPSGKNNPGATPTQITSSPFPSGVPMGRPLSHKSPSIRTPSASGQAHLNHPSTSSHQYPTPLAAATSVEDGAAFSSPSALLALGLGGITLTLGGANDGQGMHENDMQGIGMSTLSMNGPRDNDEEKRRRLGEALQLLRTRVAGRGVCREGVERLGRLEGLECLWQEDNLSIAGNFVDLEIEFVPGKECVKGVVLRYATPEAAEGETREEASEVLRRNLIQTSEDQERGSWKDMTGFHENLKQLARMDQLSQEVNCFEAIEGLYEGLKRIWEDENQGGLQNLWEHVCTGSMARPCMHLGETFGLSLPYWAERRRTLLSPQAKSEDKMDVDRPTPNNLNGNQDKVKSWAMVVECEEGYPSLRVSKEWVASPVFTALTSGEDAGNSAGQGLQLINWIEPPPTLVPTMNNNPDSMSLDPSMMANSTTPNRRFVARLDPPVDVPALAASEIYRQLGMDMPQEFKLNTYDALLFPSTQSGLSQNDAAESGDKPFPVNDRRRQKEVYTFDDNGQARKKGHEYVFHTFEQVAGRTLRDLPFSHPRQLAEVVPILRQYTLLSSIVRRAFSDPQANNAKGGKELDTATSPESKSTPALLSNIDPTESKLDDILSGGSTDSAKKSSRVFGFKPPTPPAPTVSGTETKVDVSLRTQASSAPSIMLLFNVPHEDAVEQNTHRPSDASKTITIRINVNLNGRINVSEITGIWDDASESNSGNSNSQSRTAESERLCEKLSKVMETCEDLGFLVEWVLRWLKRQRQRHLEVI